MKTLYRLVDNQVTAIYMTDAQYEICASASWAILDKHSKKLISVSNKKSPASKSKGKP
jgi:hypothetical protein